MAAEMLLQYLWEHRLWEQCDSFTTDGRRLVILDPGLRNNNAGPDFFNAKIELDGKVWAGNVEIHVRASDWRRHNHQHDPAYDNVILHVVGIEDEVICRRDGSPIPQFIIPFTDDYRRRYDAMVANPAQLPCADEIALIPPIYLTDWISSLGYERLYAKADRIIDYNQRFGGDWLATAYVAMARALGFSTNAEPMERLAFATPLRALLKHRTELPMVEALLLGQAGFIPADNAGLAPEDVAYVDTLRQHYHFLSAKYGLKAPGDLGWKMARMRPANSPLRRIAALVAMIADGFDFGRQFIHITSDADARRLLDVHLYGYWVNHYSIGRAGVHAPVAFSADTVTRLIINAVVPLLYAYGTTIGSDSHCNKAVELLEAQDPESNSVVQIFTSVGVPCHNAFTSQALIQLRRGYCEPRKCLYCRLGHRILAAKAKP